ncbi:MAG: type II toxin-antitoxin system VapC family toxin [Terracidiphilus sp.]
MKALLDTSVLVASVREADQRHEVSRGLLMKFAPHEASCAVHTLAELYATLTGMKPPNRLRPDQAVLIVEQFRARLECIALSSEEVSQTIQQTAAMKLSGGIVYDALILACARKIQAEHIYTWNVKHFQMVAPDLSRRIVTP